MQCPNGHENPEGLGYCTSCGEPLAAPATCANGHPSPQGTAFCGMCGLPVPSQSSSTNFEVVPPVSTDTSEADPRPSSRKTRRTLRAEFGRLSKTAKLGVVTCLLAAVGLGAYTLVGRGSNPSYEGPAILADATHNERVAYVAGDADGYTLLADSQTEGVETPSSLLTVCEDLQENGNGSYGSGSWSPGAPAWASLYPNWYVLGCEAGSASAVRKVWGVSITTPTVLLPSTTATTATPTTTSTSPPTLNHTNYGIDYPIAVATDGSDVWIVNHGLDDDNVAITEIDEATGGLVRVISGSKYDFSHPDAIVSDGTRVWVANSLGDSITEIDAATGALVRVITGSKYAFKFPAALAVDSRYLWVANSSGNSITQLNAGTATLVRVIVAPNYGLVGPSGLVSDGAYVWVANSNNDLDRINATGSFLNVVDSLSGPNDDLDGPTAMASDGPDVWVVNFDGDSVTEINAESGALIRVMSGASYDFADPTDIATDGTHVWVANLQGNSPAQSGSVTEFSAATGALESVISGSTDGIDAPFAVASDGTRVWITNDDSVSEIDEANGELIGIFTGKGSTSDTTTTQPSSKSVGPGFKPTGAGEPWVAATREFVYALQRADYLQDGIRMNVKGTHFWLSEDAKHPDWYMFSAVPEKQSLEDSDGFGWAELQGGSWTAVYGPYNQGCQWPSYFPKYVLTDFAYGDAGC